MVSMLCMNGSSALTFSTNTYPGLTPQTPPLPQPLALFGEFQGLMEMSSFGGQDANPVGFAFISPLLAVSISALWGQLKVHFGGTSGKPYICSLIVGLPGFTPVGSGSSRAYFSFQGKPGSNFCRNDPACLTTWGQLCLNQCYTLTFSGCSRACEILLIFAKKNFGQVKIWYVEPQYGHDTTHLSLTLTLY